MRVELSHVINRLEELAGEPLFRAEDGTPLVRVEDVYDAFGFGGFLIGALTILAGCSFMKGGLYTLVGGFVFIVLLLFADRILRAMVSFFIAGRLAEKLKEVRE